MRKIIATHLWMRKPEPDFAIPLIAICRNSDGEFYSQGNESNLFARDAIDQHIRAGDVAELLEETAIQPEQRFYLQPDGVIVYAMTQQGILDPGAKEVFVLGPDRFALSRMADTKLLQRIGLNVKDWIHDDLPVEFNRSLRELELNINLYEQGRYSDVYYADIEYPRGKRNVNLHGLTNALKRKLEDENHNLLEHPDFTFQLLLRRDIDFHSTILPFPFFWSRSLRNGYGVIRYGQQTKMGIVVRTGSSLLFDDEKKSKWGTLIERNLAEKILFQRTNEYKSKIYGFRGYIFSEIAREMHQQYASLNGDAGRVTFFL